MRVTNEQAKKDMRYPYEEYPTNQDIKIALYAADLIEARELIKEMREDLLKISQYPIAFVCEEARIIAREAWKKSKEYAE